MANDNGQQGGKAAADVTRVAIEKLIQASSEWGHGDLKKITTEWKKAEQEYQAQKQADDHGVIASVLDKYLQFPDEVKEDLEKLSDNLGWFGGILVSLVMLWSWVSYLQQYGQLAAAKNQQEIAKDLHPFLPPVQSLGRAFFSEPAIQKNVQDYLKKSGFEDDAIDAFLHSMRNFPATGEILELLRRGDITAGRAKELLYNQGYVEKEANDLLDLQKRLPPLTDIVRFADRGAYTELAQKIYSEFFEAPESFKQHAKKAGLSEEDISYYWYSHWQQPGIREMFEMMHRTDPDTEEKVLSEDMLDYTMQILGYSEYWRSRIKKITYNPYTRVDVRRMHDLDVINDDQLKTAYMDLGYDDEKAEKMKQFTIKYNRERERDLTRTQIESLYEMGKLNDEQFTSELQAIDYKEKDANLILWLKKQEKIREQAEAEIKAMEWKYKNRQVGSNEVYRVLGDAGIYAERIQELLSNWYWEMIPETQRPSKTDVLNWRKLEIIDTDEEAEKKLKQIGYTTEDANNYLKELHMTEGA